MTEKEWADVVRTIELLWPTHKPWPLDARRRCFKLLSYVEQEVVFTALDRLKGTFPPSPASLQAEVSKVLAATYTSPQALPEPKRDTASVVRWHEANDAGMVWDGWSVWLSRRHAEKEKAKQ